MEPLPIDLEDDEYQALVKDAKKQHRSPEQQAAVYVLKGLKLWTEDSIPLSLTATTSTNSKKRPERIKPSGTRQEIQA